MSGNIWKLSDQIDDMDVEMLRHDFITLREGMEYYDAGGICSPAGTYNGMLFKTSR